MDSAHDTTTSVEDVNAGEPEAELSNISLLEGASSGGDMMRELENAGEVLTRVELDLAYTSEKLVNLNILTMHVTMRESDFETFVSEKEQALDDSVEKALEFDLLSGVLDSEIRELNSFMPTLQTDIVNAGEIISSYGLLGEVSKDLEEKLIVSEESLQQSLDQVLEITEQSAKFQRILSTSSGQEGWKDEVGMEFSENGEISSSNAKIKMQTAEQQRHILRWLEKTLARELDLEKKLSESRKIEEDLKLRLHSSYQEVYFLEEEAALVWERLFESDSAAEVLMGISKEKLGQLHRIQFNLNSSIQREEELRSKLENSMEKLESKDISLQKLESSTAELNDILLSQTNTLKTSLGEAEDKLILANSEAFTLREKVSSLEKQLKESEFQLLNAKASSDASEDLCSKVHDMRCVIEDLKEKNSSAEAKCKMLTETNMELNEELKSSGNTSEKVDLLERELMESNIQLQHAKASFEASLEKQSMLDSTIRDMENLIDDLKSKVLKAESRAENVEERCIILSESNSYLNEELRNLRGRLKSLEASLLQAEETKKVTAKDIGIRTKVITDLVMQLALERERLHKQISSLTKQNRVLVGNFRTTNKDTSVTMTHDVKGYRNEFSLSKRNFTAATFTNESTTEATELSATSFELDDKQKTASVAETETASDFDTVRNIDARQLNYKYVSMAILTFVVSALAAFLFKHQNGQS